MGHRARRVPRTGGRIPGTPATGRARAGKAKTTTGAAHPRSVAPLAGRCGLPAAGLTASQGRCAVCGARRTTPTSGPASRPAARAPSTIRSRCPVGPGKRPREGRGGGDGGASAAHGRPPPRWVGDGARVRLTRDHPHVVLRSAPHVVLRCSPQVVLRYDPQVVLRGDPQVVVLGCGPRAAAGCDPAVALRRAPHVVLRPDPHVVPRCAPQVVLRCDPQVVLRCGGRRSVSPGRGPCSTTFMRLLQTCRARSRLGRFAS